MGVDQNEQLSRRGFLKGVAVTAVAATATGAGAALLGKTPTTGNVASVPSVPAAQTAVSVISSENPVEILTQLATSQAENMRLQAALAAAQRQIEAMQQDNMSSSSQTNALNVELANANEQASLLIGLVALYEQLDEVDVGEILENGVTAVSGTLNELIDHIPSFEEGIEVGQAALNKFEAHIPLLQNGRSWLNNHLGKLRLYFSAIETLLQQTVNQISSFLEMLQNWFEGVKKWLPFGIGERATEVMETITTLLIETPNTINGLKTNVADPLDVWLGNNEGQPPLQTDLLNPIRENLFKKANEAIDKARNVSVIYSNELLGVAEAAIERQKLLRELINQYRISEEL